MNQFNLADHITIRNDHPLGIRSVPCPCARVEFPYDIGPLPKELFQKTHLGSLKAVSFNTKLHQTLGVP